MVFWGRGKTEERAADGLEMVYLTTAMIPRTSTIALYVLQCVAVFLTGILLYHLGKIIVFVVLRLGLKRLKKIEF